MGHSIGNVVKLEIKENGAAPFLYGFHDRGTFGGKKFEADLAECRWLPEEIEESQGSGGIGNIEGNDDFVLGSGREFHTMRGLKK